MPAEQLRTMAVRVGDDVHTKMSALAQIQGISLNDALIRAVERYMEETGKDPKVVAKLQELQADVERRHTAEREALASLRSTVTGTPAAAKSAARDSAPKSGSTA